MASITEYVVKLQELTQMNLDILQALNDSFFTKQNHLSVNIAGNQLAIPSFISLENKINALHENFLNLVNAPESGEAFFNFDGNSRSIEVRPYTHTPNSLTLKSISEFGVDNNDIFKDFMTPIPYINLNVQDLPNDTVQVLMKKIIPIHDDLVTMFRGKLEKIEGEKTIKYPSIQHSYKDLYKVLNNYIEDVDYVEYETKLDLPIRKNIGTGLYAIEAILDDIIDDNLDNYITIQFRTDIQDSSYMNSLKYRLFDETIERPLKIGDELTTFDGKAKVVITELRPNTNTVVVKVVNGEYLNLTSSSSNNVDKMSNLCKMKFYSPIDFDKDKYVKVPLEEDQYVFIALAALNSRMNVQSAWGTGLMVNTYELLNDGEHFADYYKANVRNVGDVLHEISSIMSNTLTGYTKDEFDNICSIQPNINLDNISVIQINKHLNDSIAVKNIRGLYSQKKELQTQLDEVRESITSVTESLSQISFDDTTGIRSIYTSQLSELNTRKNELNTSITKLLNEISIAANSSEVPIENAKYHIRGFFDVKTFCRNYAPQLIDHVRGIRVQYRYKNQDAWQGTAMTLADGKFIYSDWNNMDSFDRQRIATYTNKYNFTIEDFNDNLNEPSFNQIDIPISQGENVDIRLKLVYDFGWPFIFTSSDWSPIVNVVFPEEFLKDVQILDIIAENNNDIETNRFQNIINEGGVPEHVGDKVTDQDITYFHKPENIASGFYTAERRIIPLKDKLTSIDAIITELYDEVKGSSTENLEVSIKVGETQTVLYPYQTNNVSVAAYGQFETEGADGIYSKNDNGVVSVVLNLSLNNTSTHTVKLFSIFPGNRDTQISKLSHVKYGKTGYCVGDNKGVWFRHPKYTEDCSHNAGEVTQSIQSGNQFIYFRINNPYNGEAYYSASNNGNYLSWSSNGMNSDGVPGSNFAYMYPSLNDRYGMSLDSNAVGDHLILAPGEEIIIPIIFEYKLDQGNEISKTMSVDIRTSLYSDPINFTFKVTAKYTETMQDKILSSNRKKFRTYWGERGVKFNSTIK